MMLFTPELDLAIRRLVLLGCPLETLAQLVFEVILPIKTFAAWTTFAQDFVYLILLTTWIDGGKWARQIQPLQVLELFSGKARVSKMASWLGYSVRAIDIVYCKPRRKISKHSKRRQRSSMDICGEAGIVFHGADRWLFREDCTLFV